MTDWEPATEIEAAMRDALLRQDQELYFQILAGTELLLPVSPEALAGQAPLGWGTWTTNGRTHVLAFTSPVTLRACLGDSGSSARRVNFVELAATWPNLEWWLAVNPGLPIEGWLPAWFVTQLARGDARLPGRGNQARARATAVVPGSSGYSANDPVGTVPAGPAPVSPPPPPPPTPPPSTPAPQDAWPHRDRPESTVAPTATTAPAEASLPPYGAVQSRASTVGGLSPSGLPRRVPGSPAGESAPVGEPAPAEAARPAAVAAMPGAAMPGAAMPGAAMPGAALPGAATTEAVTTRAATTPVSGDPAGTGPEPGMFTPTAPESTGTEDPGPQQPTGAAPTGSAEPTGPVFDSADDAVFEPVNDVERDLMAAAGGGGSNSFLSTLLLAKVLLPVAADSSAGAKPGDEGFTWRTETLDGETFVLVFTSSARIADHFDDPVDTVEVKFVQLIRRWPDPQWSFVINPGTPVGAKLPGTEIVGLASWAAEVGLGEEADLDPVDAKPSEGSAPPPAAAATRSKADQPTMMQKTVASSQIDYYLERGYDRVSGFVHRAGEVDHLDTPAKLHAALGLGYPGSPYGQDATDIYVLRWPAYRPSLYRIPYGGQNETAMRAMEGWVIERPPFRGNGFAPGESSDVVAEFKVDSVRLPHGSQLWRLSADGKQTLIARLDSDEPAWQRVEED
ncbi:SseB family protein [Solwaraspora sp. WMMB335]|uniref:SseB family protein n=1 Tax=Solwaraspora sp. WMMB335 TaxID=3404118 RepID=UPI003B944041